MLITIVAGAWLSLIALVDTTPTSAPAVVIGSHSESPSVKPCTGKSAEECKVSQADFKRAREAFARGIKLKDVSPEAALSAFDLAIRLVPRNAQYVSARASLLQQLAYVHIQRGNQLMTLSDTDSAATEFSKALELNPGNQFASERLLDVTHAPLRSQFTYSVFPPAAQTQETLLRPKVEQQTFHLSVDSRGAYASIGTAFGIKVKFDDSAPQRNVRLDLEKVGFEQAMDAVALITRSFWTPISSSEVVVATDTPAKRKELERWVLQSIYLPEASSPEELNTIAGMLQNMFDLRSVTQSPANRTITVRGPAPKIAVATQLVQTLWAGRPQVMLDFEVFQVTRQMLRELGIAFPSQFTMFAAPQSAMFGVGSSDSQLLISKSLASGGISPASISAIPALLSQLQHGNSLAPRRLDSSLAISGVGQTSIGLQLPPATANFSKNRSGAISLTKIALRASQGKATLFRLGTRYPVITASYTSGQTSLGTVPTVTFEDLGITLNATPAIHRDDVTLVLDMQMSSVGSQLFNGVPTINSRKYTGTITVRNNEPAVIAGSLSRTEIKSLQSVPGVGEMTALGALTSNRSTEVDEDELLVMITPHIISAIPVGESTALFLPPN
jgi:general secretion pathway protein D